MPELFLADKLGDKLRNKLDRSATVEESRLSLPDATERHQALDIRSSWIVEAPAGSGKTGLLIQRYLKLLADESVASPEQVLAITFTRKATAEMKERVLAQLQSADGSDEPANDFDRDTRSLAVAALARDRALNWQLLDQPARLNIRTIDSVCSDIAGSLPLLSGSGGRRTTVEDASPLYLTAARRTFLQLGGDDPGLDQALRLLLLHRDGNLPECERLLSEMLQHREQWGQLIPIGSQKLDDAWLDANVLPRLELALEEAICAALTQLARSIPAHLLDQLTAMAAEMAHLEGYNGQMSPIALCANKTLSPEGRAEELEHWRALAHLLVTKSEGWRKGFNSNHVGFETGKSERAKLIALVQQFSDRDDLLTAICKLNCLPPARYPLEQWVVAKALFRILNRALAELQIVFAEQSECDFTELSLAARTALRHDDGTRDLESATAIHLQHLLVDEMQDTSSSQYEFLRMLTQGWDGHSQTVFLVGDPKQSIYLFRQARVERFLGTMRTRHLGDLHLGALRLTANFRSQATLVGEFNQDFEAIFPSADDARPLEEVSFVKASAVRSSSPDSGGRIWHPAILPDVQAAAAASNTRRQRKADAREMRSIVEYWQSKPLPRGRKDPWKIAVLVRNRTHLEEIVTNFRDPLQGPQIHCRAVDIEPLETRPEVQDLFALTRALLHPADRTAWLAILHAPWCGLSLAELHTITGADDPTLARQTIMQLLAGRGDLLAPAACRRLERVWPILTAAITAAGRLPFAQTVERTWRSLGGDAFLAPSELTNSQRYLHLLDELEVRTGAPDLALLERRMKKLYAAPDIHPTAVDLLTMHKAKGLEWDVVLLPALERKSGRTHTQLLTWAELDTTSRSGEHTAAGIVLAPIAGKGEPSTELNTWIASIHRARETAERQRVFYVACTRAREELHLFASPSLTSKGDVQPSSDSLLKSAWPAAKLHFAGAIANPPLGRSLIELDEEPSFAIAASALEITEHPETSGTSSMRGPIAHGWDSDLAPAPILLKRLPTTFDPADRLRSSPPLHIGPQSGAPTIPRFERPEGSVAARAFGNAVHALLESITQRIAAGTPAANILNALPTWTSRITAILRAEGLQPALVDRLTQRVLQALSATLKDPQGLWLLSPHQDASTEYALTTWSTQRTAIRIDRVFHAGPEPHASGADHLWIVDYKTTTHGTEGVDAFLTQEREKYAPQLETYAAVLHQTDGGHTKGEPRIRLALYYPMLSKLIWWPTPNRMSS